MSAPPHPAEPALDAAGLVHLWEAGETFGHVHGPVERDDVNTGAGHALQHAGRGS